MENQDNQVQNFKNAKAPEPRAGLLDAVLLHISKADGRSFRRRIIFFAALSLIAAASFVPAWRELQNEIHSSGFSNFLSLLSTDTGSLLIYWKEFSFSLLESLPVLGLVVVLAALFAFLSSLRLLILNIFGGVRYARAARHHG